MAENEPTGYGLGTTRVDGELRPKGISKKRWAEKIYGSYNILDDPNFTEDNYSSFIDLSPLNIHHIRLLVGRSVIYAFGDYPWLDDVDLDNIVERVMRSRMPLEIGKFADETLQDALDRYIASCEHPNESAEEIQKQVSDLEAKFRKRKIGEKGIRLRIKSFLREKDKETKNSERTKAEKAVARIVKDFVPVEHDKEKITFLEGGQRVARMVQMILFVDAKKNPVKWAKEITQKKHINDINPKLYDAYAEVLAEKFGTNRDTIKQVISVQKEHKKSGKPVKKIWDEKYDASVKKSKKTANEKGESRSESARYSAYDHGGKETYDFVTKQILTGGMASVDTIRSTKDADMGSNASLDYYTITDEQSDPYQIVASAEAHSNVVSQIIQIGHQFPDMYRYAEILNNQTLTREERDGALNELEILIRHNKDAKLTLQNLLLEEGV